MSIISKKETPDCFVKGSAVSINHNFIPTLKKICDNYLSEKKITDVNDSLVISHNMLDKYKNMHYRAIVAYKNKLNSKFIFLGIKLNKDTLNLISIKEVKSPYVENGSSLEDL